jgi:hypothetical protein
MSLYPGSLIPDPIFAKGSRLGWAEHRAYPRSLHSIQRNPINLSVITRERTLRPPTPSAARGKQSPPWSYKRPVSAFFAGYAAKPTQLFCHCEGAYYATAAISIMGL